jgi:hypothetical protein
MLRRITLQTELLRHDRLIRRTELTEHAKSISTIEQAQVRAQQILDDACRDAQNLKIEGYREGMRAGIRAGIEPIVRLAEHIAWIRQDAKTQTEQRVRACFESLVVRAPVLVAIVESILESHGRDKPTHIDFTLANVDEHTRQALETACIEKGVSASVRKGAETGLFAISWPGHRWEIDASVIGAGLGRPSSARNPNEVPPAKADAWPEPPQGVEAQEDAGLDGVEVMRLCREALIASAQDLSVRIAASQSGADDQAVSARPRW